MMNKNGNIEASASVIIDLTRNINTSLKQIEALGNELSSHLKRLETTFQDQGYATIMGYISRTQNTVGEAIPHLKTVMERLIEYAELIKKSRSTIGDSGGISWTPPRHEGAREIIKRLTSTRQAWKLNTDGTRTFDSPDELGRTLISRQGTVKAFRGTCGLVSCANVIRMSGKAMTEKQIVEFAESLGLCTVAGDPRYRGGTTSRDRQKLLSYFGIENELKDATIANITKAVSEGRGLIVSVHADRLWKDDTTCCHAITITSLREDNSGNVLGFFVCDSGTNGKDSSRFYSTDEIKNALTGRPLNVTSIIR